MLGIGEIEELQGSGKKPYQIKNVDGRVWSCTCPAWRNLAMAVDLKTCKHIRAVAGAAAETARILANGGAAPVGTAIPVVMLEKEATCSPERAKELLENAASEGRKLRQDEKAKIFGPPVILAHKWDAELDPTGHWLSEKRDGVRAYWNGKDFVSRQGNIYKAPEWFKAGLPETPLDGELIIGRKQFAETISIVKSFDSGDRWKEITYEVFDSPSFAGPFEARIEHCKAVLENATYARVLNQVLCEGVAHLQKLLAEVEKLGGEGIMIRIAGSEYEIGRSYTLLKVKSFFDIEATVIGYTPGKGKNKGKLGSLECRLESGALVSVGTGLTDEDRRNPVAIGKVITVRYQELSPDGVPRFPVFVAVRDYE